MLRLRYKISINLRKQIKLPQRFLYVPRSINPSTIPTLDGLLPFSENQDPIEKKIQIKRRMLRNRSLESNNRENKSNLSEDLKSLRSLSSVISNRINGIAQTPDEKLDPKLTDLIYDDLDLANRSNSGNTEVSTVFKKDAIELPEEITTRMGLAGTYLIPSDGTTTPNWNLIVSQLQLGGGFSNLSSSTVHKFIKSIPIRDLKYLIPILQKMCSSANIELQNKTNLLFFKSLAIGGRLSEVEMELMENYFEKFASLNELKLDVYETMICAYTKFGNMNKVEQLLKEMKLNKLEISRSILTSILQGYIFYEKDFNKALETFDAMKFLSTTTQPNSRTYTDMIIACVMNKKIEKALDLYQEMLDHRLKINQNTLAALAKGCSKSKQFSSKSWDFIFNIYDQGISPNLQTIECMLNISGLEGDVDLSRALFQKLAESGSITSKSIVFLMMSYSNYSPTKKVNKIMENDRGRLFRENMIEKVDFFALQNDFPFLPVKHLSSDQLVLAESSALITFIVEFRPELISYQLVSCFLNIILNLGTFDQFKTTYNKTTFPILEKQPRQISTDIIIEEADSKFDHQVINNDIPHQIKDNDNQLNFNNQATKLPRDTIIHIIALRAAAKFKNYEFADEIILERGQYRKSSNFKSLNKKEQTKSDFEFSKALVNFYIKLNMLNDALAIVLSSEDRFQWSWKELGGLVGAALKIDDFKMAEDVKTVLRKSKNKYIK
ncbi:CCM1 [Candida jiufengensis]|uniref:CCM1 n=1 Tax=Candida jiufengensis TaxID=497108 RepID=UPI0022248BD7|nr:CCM1 [Candida jiufengensis]KAI5956992.1 CCM1 [Candida jiufengensis]